MHDKTILITGSGSFAKAFAKHALWTAQPKKVILLSRDEWLQYECEQEINDPRKKALTPDENLESLVVPEFAMISQTGETFTRDDLVGHLTVLDFFFTNCPAICPALSRSMKQIQDAVGDRGVKLLSISVDPVNDTPETLRAHAQELGADPNVWTFLRAENFEEVRRVSEDGLKLGLTLDDSRPIKTRTGDEMPWIDHTGKLVLLDQNARVIGLYSGLDQRDVVDLIERLVDATTER